MPGEPNEGLIAKAEGSAARLPEYVDSDWEDCQDLTARISHGFSFVWYRINVTFPDVVGGHSDLWTHSLAGGTGTVTFPKDEC